MNLTRIAAAVATAAVCAIAAPAAQAGVSVMGTGEPAFTNSSTNTQWVQWTSNGDYRLEFDHYVNSANVAKAGPYQVGQSGSTWVNWSGVAGVSTPLQEGSTYTICALGRWNDGTGTYWPDSLSSCGDASVRGLRASTTIDRTAPSVAVSLDGGAAATKATKLALRVDFTDNLAGPFPANFLCVQYGAAEGPLCNAGAGYTYIEQPACSQPLTSARTTNAFECFVDVADAPDGDVSVCVIAADASIPDNPSSANQAGPSSSANRSAPKCDTIALDRAAPTVRVDGPDQVRVGELASFAVHAADATSGLTGAYAWSWGDDTPAGAGQSVSHTFAQPGTYEVAVTTADVAGNPATATKTVVVRERETGGPAGPVDPGTQPPVTLAVSAPRSLAAKKARKVPVTVTVNAPGTAELTLVRGGRIVAQGAKELVAAGTASTTLKLPRKLKAGKHVLTVTFRAADGQTASAKRTVTVKGAKGNSARASAVRTKVEGRERRVLPDGEYRGPRTRTVVIG